jgi:predicted kinase
MLDKSHGVKKAVALKDREVRKDQKATEPTLLLMAGFAGAGKTTLAKRLNESLQWKMLSKDDLKLKHLKRDEEVEQAGWNAFNDLFELIEQKTIIDGESVIIDTSNEKPFIFANIEQVMQQMESHHIRAHLKVLLCVADKETRTHRLHERGSMFFPYVKELPTILEDSELATCFNHLLKDAELPAHFSYLLKDAELLRHFNHILHKKKVYIVDTNPPLETYVKSVLDEVLSELA